MRLSSMVSLTVGLLGFSSSLYARNPPPEQAFSGKLRWGACRFEDSAQADQSSNPRSKIWPIMCVRPRLSSQMLMRDDSGKENLALFYAHLYHGLYFNKHLSLHGDYEYQRLNYLGARPDHGPTAINDRRTKELFVQVGNVASDRVRLAAGKINSVFGINFHPLLEVVDASVRSNRYWSAPNLGVRATYDTLVSTVFDISVHGDAAEYKGKGVNLNDGKTGNTAMAGRVMFDIAALDGFRFVTSGYGADNGERRIGGGIVNMSSRGDFTTFEWVRLSGAVNVTNSNYQQNFRLNFTSAFRNDMRWIFDFESERKGYRMGTIGFDTRLPDYGLLRLAGSLHNGWERRTNQYFMVTTALEVAL